MKIVVFILILFTLGSIFPAKSNAESKLNGITVSPSLIHLDLDEDLPEYKIVYQNFTKSSVVLNFRAQDFKDLEEGWKVNFIEPKSAKSYRYSLSSWIKFDKKSLTLSPGEKNSITVIINDNQLAPGGHYASILAEIMQNDKNDSVTLRGILSSLLFVRVRTGSEMEKAQVANYKAHQDWWSFPFQFVFSFNNEGNVDLIPHGTIRIYDPFTRLIYKEAINPESLTTLPESFRRYEHRINTDSLLALPGIYKAELNINYGKNNKSIISNITFFTLGSSALFGAVVLLISVLAIAVIYVKKIKIIRFTPRS